MQCCRRWLLFCAYDCTTPVAWLLCLVRVVVYGVGFSPGTFVIVVAVLTETVGWRWCWLLCVLMMMCGSGSGSVLCLYDSGLNDPVSRIVGRRKRFETCCWYFLWVRPIEFVADGDWFGLETLRIGLDLRVTGVVDALLILLMNCSCWVFSLPIVILIAGFVWAKLCVSDELAVRFWGRERVLLWNCDLRFSFAGFSVVNFPTPLLWTLQVPFIVLGLGF